MRLWCLQARALQSLVEHDWAFCRTIPILACLDKTDQRAGRAGGSEDGDVSAEAGGFGNAQDDQLTSTLLG